MQGGPCRNLKANWTLAAQTAHRGRDPAPLNAEPPTVAKEEVRDFIPDLLAPNGYVVDKIEGFVVDADGVGYAVTDNDGVDDSSGETHFFSIGKL